MSALSGDRLLLRAARHGGGWTAGLAVAALTTAAANLLLPAALGAGVDAALASGDRPAAWLAIAVALIVLIAAADIMTGLAAGLGTARATARLRHTLVRHIFTLDFRAARQYPAGDLVTRLVSQAPDAAGAGAAMVLAGTALVPPLGSLVALTLIDPWLGATFVTGLLVLTFLLRAYVIDTADAATSYQRSQSDIAARLTEALVGARTIGAAGTVDQEIQRVLQPLPELGRHGRRTWAAIGLAAAQGVLVAPLLQIAVVAVGGVALSAGRLTPGALLAALQYVAIGAGLGHVVGVLGRVARSRAGCRRIAEILQANPQRYGEMALPAGPGRLDLRAVTVQHPTGGGQPPLLDGIDLAVPGGATVAVVGPSGAGKSTLAAISGRLLDPDAGEVLLDEIPLRQLRHDALRRAIGHAFARPVLVGDTVGAAIALGFSPPPDPPGDVGGRAAGFGFLPPPDPPGDVGGRAAGFGFLPPPDPPGDDGGRAAGFGFLPPPDPPGDDGGRAAEFGFSPPPDPPGDDVGTAAELGFLRPPGESGCGEGLGVSGGLGCGGGLGVSGGSGSGGGRAGAGGPGFGSGAVVALGCSGASGGPGSDSGIALGGGSSRSCWIRAAARAARVDAVVDRLPAGYDTRLADTPLSGGELQRLGVARALGAERLLVLDDATSNLDTVTEYQVGQALVNAADPRTRLVITHRAGTAARADLVAWLDRGRVRGYAAHDVLWRDPGYRALFAGAGE